MKIVRKGIYTAALTSSLLIPVAVAPVAQASSDFQDLPTKHPHYMEISTLQQLDIVNSYCYMFKPTTNISRQDVATWLNRSFDLEPIRESVAFNDVPKTSEYDDDIQSVDRAGIFDGDNFGRFNPFSSFQRGPHEPFSLYKCASILHLLISCSRTTQLLSE